jgi:hypothetical protein
MVDLKRKATDGSKTLRVQRLSATTGVKDRREQIFLISRTGQDKTDIKYFCPLRTGQDRK